jgi:hypothetical protein
VITFVEACKLNARAWAHRVPLATERSSGSSTMRMGLRFCAHVGFAHLRCWCGPLTVAAGGFALAPSSGQGWRG